jgi:hypothetical protein
LGLLATSVLALSTLRGQDAKIVADNLEYSREFYSGVHFSAISNISEEIYIAENHADHSEAE